MTSSRQPTWTVFIDESGDEGFKFGGGSSEWFVLSAVIVRKAEEVPTVKLVDAVRTLLGKPDHRPLHFKDLKHDQRLPLVEAISRARLRIISVLAHKRSLKEPEKFQQRYRLYFYSARYLFERVSWLCRDHLTHHDHGDGSAEIVFSNRSGMSYRELREYFMLLQAQGQVDDVRIDWKVVRPDQIEAYSAGRRMGLQIADAVASGFFYGVEKSRYGFTEGRYAQMLRPVVYNRDGRYLGYGVKMWPREIDQQVLRDGLLEWAMQGHK